jgi:hypothetical protein
MRVLSWLAVASIALSLFAARPATAAIASFSFGSVSGTTTNVNIDIRLNFQSGDPADRIEAVSLNFTASDPVHLTSGGTDFSRFSFDVNASALPGWSNLLPVETLGSAFLAPDDPTNGPFIHPGTLTLGTLHLDLTGIPVGTLLSVSLAGGAAGIDSTDAFLKLNGSGDVVLFSDPNANNSLQVPANLQFAVPEPSSIVLVGGLMLAGLTGSRLRSRQKPRLHSVKPA